MSRAPWLRPVAGLAAVWLLYVLAVRPAWDAPFVFDDGPGITENPAVAATSPREVLFSSPSDVTPYGRPVVSVSLAVNHAMAGYTPWSYRFFNLALHGLNTLLVYALLRNLLGAAGWKAPPAESAALAASILWLFHPLGTNVSLYIVQRAEGLVIFFLLLTLYAACRALGEDAKTKHPANVRGVWFRLTVAFCALGMLSKEIMVIAPVAVYLLDASLFSRSWREPLRRRGKWYAELASTWIVLAAVMFIWPRRHSVGTGSGWGAVQYFMVQMEVLGSYLLKALWPAELHLDYWIFEPTGWLPVVVGFLVLLALFVASAVAAVRGSPAGYLGVLAFLVLAPTSTFVPVRSMPGAEYRFYLPLLAVIFVLVWLLWSASHRFSRRHGRSVFLVLISLWVIGLAVRTNLRAEDFATPEKMWLQVKEKFPQNVRALNFLGNDAAAAGRIDEARALFRQAIEFHPEHGDAHANLGMLEGKEGNLGQARGHLEKSAELWPHSPATWSNLGVTYEALGERRLAEAALVRSIELGPHLPQHHYNLGVLYLRQERWGEGMDQIRRALELDPRHPDAHRARQQLQQAGMWCDP